MRFFAESSYGEYCLFSTNDICLAIYTAWNYSADLWEVPLNTKKNQVVYSSKFRELNVKLIFSGSDPMCGGLEEYGIEIVDPSLREEEGDSLYIRDLKTNKKYHWDDYKGKAKELKEY